MLKIKELTTEYRETPLGLDHLPRFSWKLKSDKPNTMQEKYRITVWEKNVEENRSKKEFWDTEAVTGRQSVLVPYEGKKLEPFTAYTVRIQVWDNHGETGFAESFFETGLLQKENWTAGWITHKLSPEDPMCPLFSKKIRTQKKKIRSARAYVTACGVYELQVNQNRVSDTFLAPGWTAYKKRLQYQTYDITSFLTEENEIGILVGNGWYKGYLNGEGKNCFYGDRTAVLAMIRICYEDGSVDLFGTDDEWDVKSSRILSSELYHGEKQDLTAAETILHKAVSFKTAGKIGMITAQESEPVRITEEFPAIRKFKTPKGELVLDFGQNISGFVKVMLPPLTGKMLRIRHAETLDRDGNFYTENLRTAKSTDEYVYTAEQEGQICFPHFTYHGFRYISIEGVDPEVDPACFTACVLHTDMKRTGRFACSNPLITQLEENIVWSQRDNFVEIPTDCPQRDERLGWTGDAAVFAPTAVFHFQSALFFKKWLRDLAAETDEVYGVPHMVPNIVGASVGTAVWSDAAVLIPWTLYQTYGDTEILREQYDSMQQWVEYVYRACGKDTLWLNGFQRGDWLSLDYDASVPSNHGGTDKHLVANIFYANSVRILKKTAEILGKEQDAVCYDTRFCEIKEALNKEYVTQTGRLVTETQTACALLLYFDLLEEPYRKRVIRTLEENIEQHGRHLTTGFIGTAYLLHALTENKLHHLAEDILLMEDYPGWLYAVKKGATTIWERWNSILPDGTFDTSGMNSLNHYSYGSVGDWLYKKAAGIEAADPGYRKIRIHPVPVKTMREVNASFESMYGTIACHLHYGKEQVSAEITIPENTTAVIELPGREEITEVGSGTYCFTYEASLLPEAGFSMNSKLSDLLEDEKGKALFAQYMPGNAVPEFLKGKTLNELTEMAPQMKVVIQQILQALNKNQKERG